METTDKRRKFIINVVYWAIIAGITYLIFRYLLNLLLPFVIALLVAWLLRPLSRLYRQRAPKVASALIIVTVLLFYLLLVHDRELGGPRHEHGQDVTLAMVGVLAIEVFPVILEDALVRQVVENALQAILVPIRGLEKVLEEHGHAALHVRGELSLLLGHDACQAPVVRIVLPELNEEAVGDLLCRGKHPGLEWLGTCGAGLVGVFWLVVHNLLVLEEVFGSDHAQRLAVVRVGVGG